MRRGRAEPSNARTHHEAHRDDGENGQSPNDESPHFVRRAASGWRAGCNELRWDERERNEFGRDDDGGGAGRIATREALCADVAAAGFRLEQFEDRSEALKSWAARFIFQFGSFDALWGGGCAVDQDSAGKARLGYALLIAAKPITAKSGERAPAGG